MKIAEIQEIEKTNFGNIYLFKEGIFWRAYERSAWMFVENVKHYRVLKKYVKAVKQDIVYLGFPDSALPEILLTVKTRHASSHTVRKSDVEVFIEIQGFTNIVGFEQWKSEIPVFAINKETDNQYELIIEKIKNYPVANRTPLETLEFLAKIQKEINGIV